MQRSEREISYRVMKELRKGRDVFSEPQSAKTRKREMPCRTAAITRCHSLRPSRHLPTVVFTQL